VVSLRPSPEWVWVCRHEMGPVGPILSTGFPLPAILELWLAQIWTQ
jgi:hypothetical protein